MSEARDAFGHLEVQDQGLAHAAQAIAQSAKTGTSSWITAQRGALKGSMSKTGKSKSLKG